MPKPILLHIPAVHFQPTISHPIPLSVLVILSHTSFARRLFFQTMNLVAKHISRNHFVDISITFGQKRLFRQMDYNLFAKVAILPKGYYFCAKGEAEGG